jgi:hypothetical protein
MPRPSGRGFSAEKLRALAARGAELAIKELKAEIIAIERAFPELRVSQLRRSLKQNARRTRTMSAAARKLVSIRMRRYWAERRKAKAKVR